MKKPHYLPPKPAGEKLIDASDVVLGRMASGVAKLLRAGFSVKVVNCEKAVVSGTRRFVLERASKKHSYGGALIGPYAPRRSDQLVKRTIRGMMPYKKPSGREAFKRLRCYIGFPTEFASLQKETVGKSKEKLERTGYVSVAEICKSLGGKV